MFFPKPTVLEVRCGSKIKEFEFQGVYKLAKSCSLKTSKVIISAVQSKQYSKQMFFIHDVQPTFDNLSSLKFDDESYKWENYSIIQRNLSKILIQQQKNVTELKINNTLVTFKTNVLLSTSVIFATGVTAILIFLLYCVFYRKTRVTYPQINYGPPIHHNVNTL